MGVEENQVLTTYDVEVRERQISSDIAYIWNLKKMVQMNLFTKQK